MALKKKEETIAISEFREHAEEIIRSLKQNNKTIFITELEKTTAVLLNNQDYERLIEYLEFLKAILKEKEDINAGKRTPHFQLLKEAEQWVLE